MADSMDFFNEYVMGSVEMLFGFYFYFKFLNKKVRFYYYILFEAGLAATIFLIPSGTIAGFGAYVLLLTAAGILIGRTDWRSAVLYAALVIEILQLSYGVVKSLLSVLYPLMSAFDRNVVGIAFMLGGYAASLLLTGFCCHMACRHFSAGMLSFRHVAMEKQYMFLVLIPILMIFIMGEYINSFIYGMVITDTGGVEVYTNHYHMLVMQLLGIASLFCILFAYKKLLQSCRLSTELSLLEQEEHSLIQYVEEAKTNYEKTRAFRHDIRNHITVMKKLLQNGKMEQALHYVEDMDEMAEKLSFPCSTNNPVVDILAGNKLGIARSMGIDVGCSLFLPYPCGLRDIDICIILSNALDNAIHACKSMDRGAERYIRITGRTQGDFLFMEIENSFQGNGQFRQGTGLSNVKAITEKYHGAMSIKAQGEKFVLDTLLIIPQQPESISRQMR